MLRISTSMILFDCKEEIHLMVIVCADVCVSVRIECLFVNKINSSISAWLKFVVGMFY